MLIFHLGSLKLKFLHITKDLAIHIMIVHPARLAVPNQFRDTAPTTKKYVIIHQDVTMMLPQKLLQLLLSLCILQVAFAFYAVYVLLYAQLKEEELLFIILNLLLFMQTHLSILQKLRAKIKLFKSKLTILLHKSINSKYSIQHMLLQVQLTVAISISL